MDIIPKQYFKYLSGSDGIYEIRVQARGNIFRILCFFNKNSIIICNGFQKKTEKSRKMKSTAQAKLNAILKKKSIITHEDFLDIVHGKRGTKRREEYQKGSRAFIRQVILEQENEQKIKAKKRRLSGSNSSRPSTRP
jgi:hypothetical protein